METKLQFSDLSKISILSNSFAQHGDDYIFSRFEPGLPALAFLATPRRIAGLSICVVYEGVMQVLLNSQPLEVSARSFFSLNENSIIQIVDADWRSLRCDLLFLSPKLIRDLNFDLSALDLPSMVEEGHMPVIANLSDAEIETVSDYMNLMGRNATENIDRSFSKNIARSLAQALFYQVLQIRSNHIGSKDTRSGRRAQSRQISYVQDFMSLLQLHHRKERSISFYADRLCISPKYLSHIIKQSTGRYAADWIGEFVVQEAKNMLRFSNRSIQQIAYELNFASQSSFGKYFKHLTGMSPSEYQKT